MSNKNNVLANNALGQPLTNDNGKVTKFEYDKAGRLTAIVDANSRNYIRKRGYDPLGNVTNSTDAQDNETAYEYDVLSRVKKITDAEGGVTEFSYDARDNLLQVKDPEGRLTLYSYDKNDRLLTETKGGDQNTDHQHRYAYDQNGNLISSINPEQEITTYYSSAVETMGQSTWDDAHKDCNDCE